MAKGNGKPRGRGRKAKVQDKADAPEMRKGKSTPQQLELKSDDFAFHFKNAQAAKVRMGTAKSAYDACLKAAKTVSDQMHKSVKLALSMEGKDLEAVKSDLQVLGFVLKETDHPLQLTIHDTLLGDALDVAYARGKEAGGNGMPLANIYPVGSDLAEQYATGWRNAVGGNLGLSEEETDEAVNDAPARGRERSAETIQ